MSKKKKQKGEKVFISTDGAVTWTPLKTYDLSCKDYNGVKADIDIDKLRTWTTEFTGLAGDELEITITIKSK